MRNNGMTLWARRDPFADFDALVRGAFGPTSTGPGRGFNPAADVVRTGDDAVIRLELPGLDIAKDVEVEVHDGRLVVTGERRDERVEESDGATLREIRYGSFARSFALPKSVSPDAVSASYDAGILSITVAGVYAGSSPRKVEITAGSGNEVQTIAATPEAAAQA